MTKDATKTLDVQVFCNVDDGSYYGQYVPVTILSRNGEWCKVQFESGRISTESMRYLRADGGIEAIEKAIAQARRA